MWKIKVYEERTVYAAQSETPNLGTSEDKLVHYMESDNKTVIAGFLRAIADSMDPSKKGAYRD